MPETFLTELKNVLFTERIKPGYQLRIFRGQRIVFGSDPKRGLQIAPDARSVRLVEGIKPYQLSRAAVAIEFNQTRGIIAKSLTENNLVALQYAPPTGLWQTKTLAKEKAVNAAEFTKTDNLAGQLAIDITTDDGTLVRLYCCGGASSKTPTNLDCFDFRVDLNPARDFNKKRKLATA